MAKEHASHSPSSPSTPSPLQHNLAFDKHRYVSDAIWSKGLPGSRFHYPYPKTTNNALTFLHQKYPPPVRIELTLKSHSHLRPYVTDIASTAKWQIIRDEPDLQHNFDLENIYDNLCTEWRTSNSSVRDSDRTHLMIFLSTLCHITSCRCLAHGGRRKNRKCWTITKTRPVDLIPHICCRGPFQTQESIEHLIKYIQFQLDTIHYYV